MPAQLPVNNVVRTSLKWTWADGVLGSRLFWSYTGAYPLSDATLTTFASQVATFWGENLAKHVASTISLTDVLAEDLSTGTANQGSWGGTEAGTSANGEAPNQCAMNLEFHIAARYRGGHPRIMHPLAGGGFFADASHWTAGEAAAFANDFVTFVSDVVTNGGGTLLLPGGQHCVVSRYRDKALLAVPVVYTVQSYEGKTLIGSQRRRRTSTS